MAKTLQFPSTFRWQPFAMPTAFPVPLVQPTPLRLTDAIVLDAPVAHLLSLGLGRVDMDLRWMWTWDRDGVVRLFRSWTGREVFRLKLEPLDLVPGGRWQVAAVEVEAGAGTEPTEVLRSVLRSVEAVQSVLEDIPRDRASAVRRGRERGAPWPPPTDEQARDIDRRLPRRVVRLRMRDRDVPIPDDLLLVGARAEDDALLLLFSDGSLLWLHQAWRIGVLDTVVSTDVGGVLLWPAAAWPLSEPVGAWRALRGIHEEAARDPTGRPLDLDALAPEQPLPQPDTLVEITLTDVVPSGHR